MTPWETLGVATDVAVPDLRRRYAALIKEFRPETHPQDFARIREAYEVVLPHARRREALATERAEAELVAVDVAPVDVVAEVVAFVDEDSVAPAEVIVQAPAEEAPPEPDAEPELAGLFRRFNARADSARGSDDAAHLPALRELLQARTAATLDHSQALEFALMRWFVEAEAPPLTLLFETGRAFDWHRHPARLSNWLSPWALRQLEARLSLSRDLVFARHFSGNARLRRLHAKQAGWPTPVWRPAALEAASWVERWQRLCSDADAAPLAACLNAVSIRRLRGPASTDLLLGFAAAMAVSDLPAAIAWGLLASAVLSGLRRGLQAIDGWPEPHVARRVMRWMSAKFAAVGVIAAIAGVAGLAIAANEPAPGSEAIGWMLIAPAVLIGIAALWRLAAFVELLLAWPFQWRGAVDRLEFDCLVRSSAAPASTQPFGQRLAMLQRLKAIPAALRLQDVEIATRERPPRARLFDPSRIKGLRFVGFKGQNRWRLVWFAVWVAYAIARLTHAIGH